MVHATRISHCSIGQPRNGPSANAGSEKTSDAHAQLAMTDAVSSTTPHPGCVQQVVGARGFDDLGLLLQVEIAPGKLAVNVLLVQLHDFVVADGPRVGVVHDAGQPSSGLSAGLRRLMATASAVLCSTPLCQQKHPSSMEQH